MTWSQPYQNFRNALSNAGCVAETIGSIKDDSGDRIERLRIMRPGKDPLIAIVVDVPGDGYQLYLETQNLQIWNDVRAIMGFDHLTFTNRTYD